jgi:tRNA pseudouridine55 synthase
MSRKGRTFPPCFLVIDKPIGPTSHNVVALLRVALGRVRVGHTGTLDPFASGVLPLAIGSATRWISFLDEQWKEYEADLRLGEKSNTGDCEGSIVARAEVPLLAASEIEEALAQFIGKQPQMVPAFSAVKKDGRRLYDYARAGEEVDRPTRMIEIASISLLSFDGDRIRFKLRCSRGTYVRTLGEDIAEALGTVGHLTALRRVQSGPFTLEHAVDPVELLRILGVSSPWWGCRFNVSFDPDEVWQRLEEYRLTLADSFRTLPTVPLEQQVADRVRNGIDPKPGFLPLHEVGAIVGFTYEGELIALARHDSNRIKLLRVISASSSSG